jgi:hypothetical protein
MGPRLNSRGDMIIATPRVSVNGLQWGRDLIVAETGASSRHRGKKRSLQWGRDLIVAETSMTSAAVEAASCFNGAAT